MGLVSRGESGGLESWGSQGGLVVINRASHLCDHGSILARVACGLSCSRSQSDSEGFSLGTPVFLPPQNRLAAKIHLAVVLCSEIIHGPYSGSQRRLIYAFGPVSSSCALRNSATRLQGRVISRRSFFFFFFNHKVHLLVDNRNGTGTDTKAVVFSIKHGG